MSKNYTSTIEEFEKLVGENASSEERISELSKLANSSMDRKTLNREIAKAQKDLGKARNEHIAATGMLADLQARVTNAEGALNRATQRLVALTEASRNLDLSGAESVSEHSDGFAYVVDGRKVHVDSSDVNDIKMTPWREHVRSMKDSSIDSFEDEIEGVYDLEDLSHLGETEDEEKELPNDMGDSSFAWDGFTFASPVKTTIDNLGVNKIAKKKFR